MNFTYHLPVNLIFGRGCIRSIGNIAAQYGSKALLVTGKSSTKKSGLLEKTILLLQDSGIAVEVFDQVTQNPLTVTVASGAELAVRTDCNLIVGLGGGSIMDAAKAIAFSVKNPGDISDYIYAQKQGNEALPIILIPTTAGTGSEGNSFSVLTNPETKDKKSLKGNCLIAKASLIDPELMVTMPRAVIASVGFDALAHNMEAYVSKNAQPFSDMQALYAINLIAKNLKQVYEHPDDLNAWENVTLGSTLGGMAIHTAGVTAPHGMEHPASGLREIVHGKGLAALTPVIVKNSWQFAEEKYADISRLLGGKCAEDCADRITELLESVQLNVTLGALGIHKEDIDWMAENCIKVSTPSMKNHPKLFHLDEIKKLYMLAL